MVDQKTKPKTENIIVGVMTVLLAAGYIVYLLTGITAPVITVLVANLGALTWHAKRRIERE